MMTTRPHGKPPPDAFRQAAILLAAGAAAFLLCACGGKPEAPAPRPSWDKPTEHPDLSLAPQSAQCGVCHEKAFTEWDDSHHAWANRTLKPSLDATAFQAGELQAGHSIWNFSGAMAPRVGWSDGEEKVDTAPSMAIGRVPLVQYLVPAGNGREQVPDMAWDPAKKEWFSIYGPDDRRPHEWGHWTQRGMNWNSQCAWCHMTDFRKGYDAKKDGYHSTWTEQGVGCAQCHGPVKSGAAAADCMIDVTRKFTPRQQMDTCATCHARREEFNEDFKPGADFHDHYRLALPSQPGLYYADGQQLDEVYNFTSLLLSKMGHAGVTCADCHDPHTGKPKLPVNDNTLCLSCHGPGTERGGKKAQVINPLEHMFHDTGTPGGRCVDCHMRLTPYMGRDPRHDHGFLIPDPLLTKELGIPNACSQCHTDKDIDWAIQTVDKWYGKKMERPARARTRAVAKAHAGEPAALEALLAVYPGQEIGAWKATILHLLEPWAGEPRVNRIAAEAAENPDPLVRAAAAAVLAPQPLEAAARAKFLADPSKAVRIEAAWAGLDHLPPDHPAVKEVADWTAHQADQPAGAMREARLAMKRGDIPTAEKAFGRAIAWDRSSALPRRDFAVFLAGQGRLAEAIPHLQSAVALDPASSELPYLLALARAETGDGKGAEAGFREAIRRDPAFARAHYNLGLLLAGDGKEAEAITALREAENRDPASPDAPYARATIHARLGQQTEAIAAAREALRRDPRHQPAADLLRTMSGQ